MDMRRLVGRNFGRIRRAKDLTQEQVEELSGHSQQYLSSLERGRRNPTVVTLFELAQALGVSHIELVQPDGEHDEPTPARNAGRAPRRKRGSP